LNLARQYTLPPRPALIIAHGLSGSGKTTETQALVDGGGAVRIRSDVERKRLFGLSPDARTNSPRDGGLYGPEATAKTYEHLAAVAQRVIRAGFPAIVDAAFLRRGQRDRFRDLARELGVPFVLLEFDAPEAVLRERIAARERAGGDASEATGAVLDLQLRSREPLTEEERAVSVRVAPDAPLDVPALLATWGGPASRAEGPI
jgi:hypothetical protein